jgi:hypothetical protein
VALKFDDAVYTAGVSGLVRCDILKFPLIMKFLYALPTPVIAAAVVNGGSSSDHD